MTAKVVGSGEFNQLAMGGGQTQEAIQPFKQASANGEWLLLKNPHLAVAVGVATRRAVATGMRSNPSKQPHEPDMASPSKASRTPTETALRSRVDGGQEALLQRPFSQPGHQRPVLDPKCGERPGRVGIVLRVEGG